MKDKPLPVVFLLGPTAAGKTEVAMQLVSMMPADIVSVDSAMIYKDMNIGTAKPSATELAAAPHALIDILDPAESWSVGEFCRRAFAEIERSHARGRVPILTGGTMMYFRALQDGLATLPERDTQTRDKINALAQQHDWPHVHAQLAKVDSLAAARIHPNDAQRIQRALEVFMLTGVSLSELQQQSKQSFPYPLIKYALLYEAREQLHERINRRFDQMMQRGFLDEVQALFERGDLQPDLPAMRCVGYRQLWQYLSGDVSLEQACADAKTATRQLAKRQMTWIRSDQNLHTFTGNSTDSARVISQMWAKY